MRYKLATVFLAAVFVLALSAGLGSALREPEISPEVKASITYDPVTAHADVVDLDGLREVEIYFRYREEGGEWVETESRTMTSEGVYSKILEDIDPEKAYEFEVVAEWMDDEIKTFKTEPGPAEFEYKNLRAEPDKIYVNDTTTLKLDVENVGGRSGETKVNFTVDDWEDSRTIEVAPGEKQTVSVEYTARELGEYYAEAGGRFTVFNTVDYPSVEAIEATDITYDSVRLRAELKDIALEDEVQVYFRYRREDGEWMETEKKTMEAEGKFSQKVEELDPDSRYDFMAVVEWNDQRRIREEKTVKSRSIEVKPRAFVDESMRGVKDVGVFLWGDGRSLTSNIIEYRWDFYGDGEWDYVSNETGRTLYVYNETGVYDAVFEVEDGDGEVDRKTLEVEIRERRQPLYEIDEEAEGLGRDVYFGTDYWYNEVENETSVAVNVKNTANESRFVSITVDMPKDVVADIEDMKTFPGPTEVLEDNPKAVWKFNLGPEETARIEIVFDGHIEVERFDDMKMVQAYETEEDVRVRTITGLIIRGIRRVWGFIVIIIVAVVAVLLLSTGGKKSFDRAVSKFKNNIHPDENGGSKTNSKKKKDKKKKAKKKELDEKFIETARNVKKALRKDEITNPHKVVEDLEMANEALERGEVGRFRQHLDRVENEMEYGVFSNNIVS